MFPSFPRRENFYSLYHFTSLHYFLYVFSTSYLSPTVLPALLTRETCRTISRVCALLFLPSLVVSSTGSTLTPSILRDSWQLVVAAGFTILMSAATAWVLARAFLKREDCRAFLPVQLAIAFPNSGAFPLLMMDSLCQQDTINRYESFYICTIQWNTML